MIKLAEARTYVAEHVRSQYSVDLFDRFFDRFQTGAYVLLGPRQAFASADYFRYSTDRLRSIIVYRFLDADRSRVHARWIGFDHPSPRKSDLSETLKLVSNYLNLYEEADEAESSELEPLLTDIAEPGLPVDGAFMVVSHEIQDFSEERAYHITRPYLTPANSRGLLYTALDTTLKGKMRQ